MIGAQWTGIVTTIAIEMLRTGMVEAVICVQRYATINCNLHILMYCFDAHHSLTHECSVTRIIGSSDPEDRFTPRPILARCINSLSICYSIISFYFFIFQLTSFLDYD